MKDTILKIINNENISFDEMTETMTYILNGHASSAQIAAFLVSLHNKGETASEIAAGAKVMREFATPIKNHSDGIDTCGTGGDGSNTFNISTAVAIVAAACGAKVVKHGSSSVSSRSGSADVLRALGVNIDLSADDVSVCISKTNLGFMFAPNFHPLMRNVAPIRKELGLRSIFNLLGPLSNPAGCDYQVLGVYDESLTEVMANALNMLGVKGAMVVHGLDGLDEISTTTKTKVSELRNGVVDTYYISPFDFGITYAEPKDLVGGEVYDNAQIINEIFNGQEGPKLDIVCVNTGAVLYVYGMCDSLQEGFKIAKEAILSKKALNKLNDFIAASRGDCHDTL